jgi:iron complex outermembrane receptor protein
VDKLNGYRKVGDVLAVSHESARGILRTGLWFEWAYTDRYQIPSDPRTWVDLALPNFHEHYITDSFQPFVEYEYKVTRDLSITGGIKFANYKMDFTQYADNGTQAVGNLNGAPYVAHNASFRSWMPSLDARYKLRPNWTVYAQFATAA